MEQRLQNIILKLEELKKEISALPVKNLSLYKGENINEDGSFAINYQFSINVSSDGEQE